MQGNTSSGPPPKVSNKMRKAQIVHLNSRNKAAWQTCEKIPRARIMLLVESLGPGVPRPLSPKSGLSMRVVFRQPSRSGPILRSQACRLETSIQVIRFFIDQGNLTGRDQGRVGGAACGELAMCWRVAGGGLHTLRLPGSKCFDQHSSASRGSCGGAVGACGVLATGWRVAGCGLHISSTRP